MCILIWFLHIYMQTIFKENRHFMWTIIIIYHIDTEKGKGERYIACVVTKNNYQLSFLFFYCFISLSIIVLTAILLQNFVQQLEDHMTVYSQTCLVLYGHHISLQQMQIYTVKSYLPATSVLVFLWRSYPDHCLKWS